MPRGSVERMLNQEGLRGRSFSWVSSGKQQQQEDNPPPLQNLDVVWICQIDVVWICQIRCGVDLSDSCGVDLSDQMNQDNWAFASSGELKLIYLSGKLPESFNSDELR